MISILWRNMMTKTLDYAEMRNGEIILGFKTEGLERWHAAKIKTGMTRDEIGIELIRLGQALINDDKLD